MSHNAENWVPRGERKQFVDDDEWEPRGKPIPYSATCDCMFCAQKWLESIANPSGGTSGQVSGENAPEPLELRINGDSVEFHTAPNVEIKEIRAQTFGNKTYTRTLYTQETRTNCPNCQHKPHPGRCFNMVPVEHGENSCTCRG